MLDRPLDMAAITGLAVEILRGEDRRQERLDLETVAAQDRSELLAQPRRHLVAHEKAVDLRRQIVRRRRLLEDDLQHVDAVESSGAAEECLGAPVVLAG